MQNYKTLQEICEEIGVTRRAVQGYEKAGLVKPASKNKYGYLLYDEATQKRISQIKLYQTFGFTIKEIIKLEEADNSKRIELLKEQLNHLQTDRKVLECAISSIKDMIHTIKNKQ